MSLPSGRPTFFHWLCCLWQVFMGGGHYGHGFLLPVVQKGSWRSLLGCGLDGIGTGRRKGRELDCRQKLLGECQEAGALRISST